MKKRVLILHSGGTLGMVGQPGSLIPSDAPLDALLYKVPELADIADLKLEILARIDSCDVRGHMWIEWANRIRHDDWADGFVMIHGTDTMAYTASVLSFLLEERTRPVVLTGSQRPLSAIRNDARQNVVDATFLACSHIPEVTVCFGSLGLRGNRTLKRSCSKMGAFESPNCPPLADLGVDIHWGDHYLKKGGAERRLALGDRVKLSWPVPDLPPPSIWKPDGVGIHVLACLGAGNLPMRTGWPHLLRKERERGIIHMVVSQCPHGSVKPGYYDTSQTLEEVGAIDGGDTSYIAAVSKARIALGQGFSDSALREYLYESVAGERTTVFSPPVP